MDSLYMLFDLPSLNSVVLSVSFLNFLDSICPALKCLIGWSLPANLSRWLIGAFVRSLFLPDPTPPSWPNLKVFTVYVKFICLFRVGLLGPRRLDPLARGFTFSRQISVIVELKSCQKGSTDVVFFFLPSSSFRFLIWSASSSMLVVNFFFVRF